MSQPQSQPPTPTVIQVFLAAVPAGRIDGLEAWLDEDDFRRIGRLVFEADRRSHEAAQVLLRLGLNTVHGRAQRWQFARGTHGKPFVTGPDASLCFNLSHTRGMVAVAVLQLTAPRPGSFTGNKICFTANAANAANWRGHEGLLGVDVEADKQAPLIAGMAHEVLAESELEAWRALPQEAGDRRLVDLWVAKEAVAKALGLGLQLPLRQIVFAVEPPADCRDPQLENKRWRQPGTYLRLAGLPPGAGDPKDWVVFWRHQMGHALAVAACCASDSLLSLFCSAANMNVKWNTILFHCSRIHKAAD